MSPRPSFSSRLEALRKSANIRSAERLVRKGWKGDGKQVGYTALKWGSKP